MYLKRTSSEYFLALTDERQDSKSGEVSKGDECRNVAEKNQQCRFNRNSHLSSNKIYIVQKKADNCFGIYPVSSKVAEQKLKYVFNVPIDKPACQTVPL